MKENKYQINNYNSDNCHISISISYVSSLYSSSKYNIKYRKTDMENNKLEPKGIIYPLGEFTTNLSDKGFIKLKIELEVKDKNAVVAIENRESEYKDKVINVIRSKTLSEANGKEGMENIRMSIKNELNRIQGSEIIINVFFTEMIIN